LPADAEAAHDEHEAAAAPAEPQSVGDIDGEPVDDGDDLAAVLADAGVLAPLSGP